MQRTDKHVSGYFISRRSLIITVFMRLIFMLMYDSKAVERRSQVIL